MADNRPFTFAISLSVLNHLGRHLYRSFGTVLGEAISNAWDADAKNVWIYLDHDRNGFWIKDDGLGMTAKDFQEKFLKIGYTKRKGGKSRSKKGRPFIGRKGIGKLALLSCAKRITDEHLSDLAENTEFLWKVGTREDPYVRRVERAFASKQRDHEKRRIKIAGAAGFIASVHRPKDLKIMTTEERIGVDLFVNGRLRERDILKHIPTARIVENYLYGQIHVDGLEGKEDRFTSSREGIVADDPKYQQFLTVFRKALLRIVEDWDTWRRKHRQEGDPENPAVSPTARASAGLYNLVAKGYEPLKGARADKVDGWVTELASDAAFNFESYAECFVSENLIRKFIKDKPVPLSPEAKAVAKDLRGREAANKGKGNISIQIRREKGDLSYLAMDDLANLVDKPGDKTKEASLSRDASEFKPMRDAVAHTALLTDEAKAKLTTVRQNIKGRVKTLLK